jgi:hypothetical protein
VSTDPGGFFGAPGATPAAAEPWAVSAVPQTLTPPVPGQRAGFEMPTRSQVPVGRRKRTSYERTRMVVGGIILAFVGVIVGISFAIQGQGAKDASDAATHALHAAGGAVVESALSEAADAEETVAAGRGAYTTSLAALKAAGYPASKTVTLSVVSATGTTHYCLKATSPLSGTLYLDSAGGGPSAKPCR